MKKIKDKVVAITGAGSGIGRELAIQCAERGCQLSLSDINLDTLKETAEIISKYGVVCHIDQVDVSNNDQVSAWADKVNDRFGLLDVLINNAGVVIGDESVSKTQIKDAEWIMGINFWGTVYCTKAFLPLLKSAEQGCLVNLSSIMGNVGVPNGAYYSSSKFAIRGFTESLRQELLMEKSSVSVTCVHPGVIKTNLLKNARYDEDSVSGTDKAGFVDNFESLPGVTPQKAAEAILKGAEKGKGRILIGGDAFRLDILQRLMPVSYQSVIMKRMSQMES